MNVKRLLAFTLVGTLSLSNIAWAGLPVPKIPVIQERRISSKASASNAGKKKATPSNVAAIKTSPSNAMLSAERAEKSKEITWEIDTEKIYCGSSLEVKVHNGGESDADFRVLVQTPDSTTKQTDRVTIPADETETITISGETFSVPGMYVLKVVDRNGEEKEYSDPFTVMVTKLDALTVTFKDQALTKEYNGRETRIRKIDASSFTAEADGKELTGLCLTNVSCVREGKEEPGSYAVTKLKADQCDNITVTKNEFAFFVIRKISSELTFKKVNVPMDGTEQVIDIAQISNIPTGQDITSVKVGEIDEWIKQQFDSLPVAEGTKIRFTLAKSASSQDQTIWIPLSIEGTYYDYGENRLELNGTNRLYVETRTEDEIRAYFEAYPFDVSASDTWEIAPDKDQEIAGKLSRESVNNGLNALNFLRYVAGISHQVINNSTYEELAQTGTVLLERAGKMDHHPDQPAGVSDAFYNKGYSGTSSSNLGSGYRSIVRSLLDGWIEDGDPRNMVNVGHRRWTLDPGMKETGFGHSGSYTAMYVLGNRDYNDSNNYDYVPWPAQTMPIEFFNGPWSISVNRKLGINWSSIGDDLTVQMYSSRFDNGFIELNSSNQDTSGKYLNVSTGGYGYGPAIIFNPDVAFEAGDQVKVVVSGLIDQNGNIQNISYTVDFFSMDVEIPPEILLEGITLNEDSLTVEKGTFAVLEASMVPEDASDADIEDVVWTSSNPEVADVYNGVVSGIKDGTAVITAELNGKKAACTVTVKTIVRLQELHLNVESLDINQEKTYQLQAILVPADANDVSLSDVKWSSSDESLVKVDGNGLVTTLRQEQLGSLSAVVTAELGGKRAFCRIRVVKAPEGKATVLADGLEKVIRIEDAGLSRLGESVTVSLGELPESAKEYFSVQPTAEGRSVRFALKPSATAFQVDIPLAMVGEGYTEYNHELVLKVSAQPLISPKAKTDQEIRNFFNSHKFDTSKQDTWTVTPDGAKEEAGKLTRDSVNNGLNALNFVRYIAGLNANVTSNEEYEAAAQAGTTLLMYRNNGLSHTPDKPEGMSEEFYQLGYGGTSSSNLGWGHTNLAEDIIGGWMNDGSSSNISRVGHRRWCLNPQMGQTGFGHSGTYMGMYAFDQSNEGEDYSYVLWPAQVMPIEYFKGPWSISLNPEIYSRQKKGDLVVTMTNETSGTVYTLDESCKDTSGKYLNLDGNFYGFGPAVIFQPGVSFRSGDKVSVKITGLKDDYGNDLVIEYSVRFFSMNSGSGSSGSGSGSSGSGSGSSGSGSGSSGSGSGSSGSGSGSSGSGSGSSGGGSGSSGSGSSSSGRSGGSVSNGGPGASQSSDALPSYVVVGTWIEVNGQWQFIDSAGQQYRNAWAAVYNPYANTAAGQSNFDWFRFDEAGNMVVGWFLDYDGNYYYLNPVSDGTRGRMMTGWAWIPDAFGVNKCYYLNPVSDGYRGRMYSNTVVEGYTVNADGQWTVNGVIQTR